MTEEEIMEAFELINQTFPFLYPYPPFDWADPDAKEAYFEKMVAPNMWGDLPLLMNMLSRAKNLCELNPELMKEHIEDYLSAMHRLAPEEYFIQIEPYLDDPKLRPSLFWSIAMNFFPQSYYWFKPWVERLGQLDDDEILILIDEIGESRKVEALPLLERIRSEVALERVEIHRELDLFLNEPEQFIG